MAVTLMDGLPLELLRLILRCTLNSDEQGSRHLSRALRVCQQWNKAGHGLLWENVYLNRNNVKRFLRSPSVTHHGLIRKLTVYGYPTSAVRKHQVRNKKRIRVDNRSSSTFMRLVACIRRMDHLTTLSICDDINATDAWSGVESFNTTRIQHFINKLPVSVKNLEIDMLLYEDSDIEAQNCLSTTIARILPKLEHLRLRIPKLCPSLLVPSRAMHSLTINMSWMNLHGTCCCRGDTERKDRLEFFDDRALFVKAFTSLLDKSPEAYPKMEHFTLINIHNFDEVWCGPSHSLIKDDFLTRETTIYPLWCINEEDVTAEEELWAMRVNSSSSTNARDIVGPIAPLEAYAESSTWSQDSKGIRSISDGHISKTQPPNTIPMSEKLKQSCSTFSEECSVWNHEAISGDCLLAPQVRNLGDTPRIDFSKYGPCPDKNLCSTISGAGLEVKDEHASAHEKQ